MPDYLFETLIFFNLVCNVNLVLYHVLFCIFVGYASAIMLQ